MPTCPGCQQRIPYTELSIHLESCHGIWADSEGERQWARHLARKLREIDRRMDDASKRARNIPGVRRRNREDTVDDSSSEP